MARFLAGGMMKQNFIRCKFCKWKTNKWDGTSDPSKAFARLRRHIDSEHWQEGHKLDSQVLAFEEDLEERERLEPR